MAVGVCRAAEGDACFGGFGKVGGVCLPEVVQQLAHDDAVLSGKGPPRADLLADGSQCPSACGAAEAVRSCAACCLANRRWAMRSLRAQSPARRGAAVRPDRARGA